MKYLFIDTETTGLPKDRNSSPMESDKWPRLVSVAYILCEERIIVDKDYFIIKPNGFIIPSESTKVHGITTADAISKGCTLSDVLDCIKSKIDECAIIIGHNVAFDINVLDSEFYRYNNTLPVHLKPHLCTMELSKDFCGLPNNKYPSLEELYSTLKGESIANAHNAMADTQAAMECFWILNDSGIIKSQGKKTEVRIYPTKDNLHWASKLASISSYAALVRAFFTIAYNLEYNKRVFLGFNIVTPDHKKPIIVPPTPKLTEENGELVKKEYSEREWIDDSFKYFYEELYKEGIKSRLIEAVRNLEKEVGGDSLMAKFQIKRPYSPFDTFVLENETDWLDIAINISRNRPPFPSDRVVNLEVKYFKLMIKHLNEIRKEENSKEWEKHNETKKYFAKYGVDINKGEMPNAKQVQQMMRDRDKTTDNRSSDNFAVSASIFICIAALILLAIGKCGGDMNGVTQTNNDIVVDSLEDIDSTVIGDGAIESEYETKTFSNGIYSIQYPKDWVVTKNINEFTDVHIGSTTANIGLTIIQFSTEQSLNDVQKSSDENMVNAGFDIVEKQELIINGSKAYERTYFTIDKNVDIFSDNYNIAFMSYILKKDSIIYNIKFGNCYKDEHAKIARKLINTFMFIN